MKFSGARGEVILMTLDPGHFHAALVQKYMYEQVSPKVYVYAPEGPDIIDHLDRIQAFNKRRDNPTQWKEILYIGSNFLDKMLEDRSGNVVILAGNNRKKTEYIKACVAAGLNVLSDKPMCINRDGFKLLEEAFKLAAEQGVLLYDIMTERFEITTILQMKLANMPEVFGTAVTGSADNPAIVKESVHYLYKLVAGVPLKRPAWYVDTTQQGEGLVDITTHLVDMSMWECFPGEVIDYKRDVRVLSARHWPTVLTLAQYQGITQLAEFPDYLQPGLDKNGCYPCYCNGEMLYTLRGRFARIKVVWDYQAPAGAGDTHFSVIRGSQANILIRQGKEESYRPELYVEPANDSDRKKLETALPRAITWLQVDYPGIELQQKDGRWQVMIPPKYRIGHEAHFAQVTKNYLQYLVDGKLPDWEVPNMLAKYYITTTALEMVQ